MRARYLVLAVIAVSLAMAGGAVIAQQGATQPPRPDVSITTKDLMAGLSNPARWLTYSGDYSGQRHSLLKQITPANVAQLSAQWTFQTAVTSGFRTQFEATPVVIDGVIYQTGPLNYAWAIDAKTGRQIWQYRKILPPSDTLRVCCGLVNRGFAVLGNRLFMTTLDAHLVALDLKTGKEVWDVAMADYKAGHAGTGAPLVIKDKVVVGIAGGEFAIRGFIDAYDAQTGQRAWRFWTIPAPGEPGSQTWPADTWERGGAPTWLTGTYDPELNLMYWGTGNPNPDLYGGNRPGDNLYSASVVALDADTGTLKWHYQFTPHDEHDWDANQVPVLADLAVAGRQRKVLMAANRNGFFYVIDRTNGEFLFAKPYIKQTWAKEIGKDGRPVELPDQRPTPKGTLTCPDLFGGTNFMSPSYDPAARLFFVSARETCMVYVSQPPPSVYKAGDRTMGGSFRAGGERGYGALRAIDAATGDVKWELRHDSPSWAGVLSTAGGVVFTGTNEGDLVAADSRSGKELWRYQLGHPLYAGPATFMLDNRQYLVAGAGTTLTAFAAPR